MDELHKTLWTYYGYSSFRPGQERLIRALLEGNDVLGVMPTGAGKSLCYQIPALLLPGLTIVVSPLISLMEDQVGTLRKRGIPAAFLHAAMRSSERRALCQKILDGQRTGSPGTIRLLYVSPERLMAREFLSFSENADISLLAVDEAHCISNWGRDFRPAYRKIGDFADRLKRRPPIGAFTASATPAVREEIISYLHLKEPASLTTGFDRPNLYFEVRHAEDKWTELLRVLAEHRTGTGIIYCLTRKTTEALAKKLNKNGIPAAFYHGGLTSCEREKSQEDWIRGRVRLIVATCAFGMGIDKPDVRFVIHYNLPGSMENYYQEAGRASRDGRPGECILQIFYSKGGKRKQRGIPSGDAAAGSSGHAGLCELSHLPASLHASLFRGGDRTFLRKVLRLPERYGSSPTGKYAHPRRGISRTLPGAQSSPTGSREQAGKASL